MDRLGRSGDAQLIPLRGQRLGNHSVTLCCKRPARPGLAHWFVATRLSLRIGSLGSSGGYLRSVADSVRKFGYLVVIGFGHEMNACQYCVWRLYTNSMAGEDLVGISRWRPLGYSD